MAMLFKKIAEGSCKSDVDALPCQPYALGAGLLRFLPARGTLKMEDEARGIPY